jgi:hypothetical protein
MVKRHAEEMLDSVLKNQTITEQAVDVSTWGGGLHRMGASVPGVQDSESARGALRPMHRDAMSQ